MRVLHIVEGLSAESGGLSRAVTGLSDGLVRRGHEVKIVSPDHGKNISPQAAHLQPFSGGPLGRWNLTKAVRKAAGWSDLIHIHGLWCFPQFIASRAAWWIGKPYIVSPHGMLDPWALGQRRIRKQLYGHLIERRTLKRASAIHALTEREALDIQRLESGRPVYTIPNGIDPSEFDALPDREVFERRFPQIAGKRVILFLGRIHPKKGLDLLAQAFAEVARSRVEAFLMIAGPDENGYLSRIESSLKKLVPEDRFLFTGLLESNGRLAALAAADLFVLPSYSEGLPVAAVEAMAAGLPVILSEACNIDAAGAGAGLVVPTDATALCKAILHVIDNPSQAIAMGRRAREFISTNHTWDNIASQMVDAYERVIAEQTIAA